MDQIGELRSEILCLYFHMAMLPSVLRHCWLAGRKCIRPKIERCGAGVVFYLEQSADDLHMVQLMPLHPIISCIIKIQNDSPFWYWLTHVVLKKRQFIG